MLHSVLCFVGCDRCIQHGYHDGHRVTFPNMSAELRTDESFRQRLYPEHHRGVSPFEELDINMISVFPLDYMHLCLLGITKRTITYWMRGPGPFRLGPTAKNAISEKLLSLRKLVCREFARKPRSLFDVDRWKATEFRLFLLYIGYTCTRDWLEKKYSRNFLTFSIAIRILADPNIKPTDLTLAGELLLAFVKEYKDLYGEGAMVYNVHALIHLPIDVARLGNLDTFSAFPFENYLQELKTMVRKGDSVMAQLINKLELCEFAGNSKMRANEMHLLKEIANGPLPVGERYKNVKQYKNLVCDEFYMSVDEPNNSFLIDKHISLVRNIILIDNLTYVVYVVYEAQHNYFTEPLQSSRIGVHRVARLSQDLRVAPIKNVVRKLIIITDTKGEISYPLLHTKGQ